MNPKEWQNNWETTKIGKAAFCDAETVELDTSGGRTLVHVKHSLSQESHSSSSIFQNVLTYLLGRLVETSYDSKITRIDYPPGAQVDTNSILHPILKFFNLQPKLFPGQFDASQKTEKGVRAKIRRWGKIGARFHNSTLLPERQNVVYYGSGEWMCDARNEKSGVFAFPVSISPDVWHMTGYSRSTAAKKAAFIK